MYSRKSFSQMSSSHPQSRLAISIVTTNSMPAFLQDTPYDIRVCIYKAFFTTTPITKHQRIYTLKDRPAYLQTSQRCPCPPENSLDYLSLLLTCKITYEEAYPIFLRCAPVEFKICQNVFAADFTCHMRSVITPAVLSMLMSRLDAFVEDVAGDGNGIMHLEILCEDYVFICK